MTAASFFTAVAGVIAVIGLAVFLFGIPPELKRKMERTALKTMGENKLSYVAKGIVTCSPCDNEQQEAHLRSCSRCTTDHMLTTSRPDQQDPHLRPDRPPPAQEGRL
jgi:hypothetical protein